MEPSIHISSPKLLCVCSLILLPGAFESVPAQVCPVAEPTTAPQ